ncbi:MAG: hypothetical protein A2Y07_10670 [Planctomycetes bacterium GWF2_50_10]|nr:MAG: hypothetical protein A2Y07_10670 [Planctomycetes bacterium GWF2_50_10]
MKKLLTLIYSPAGPAEVLKLAFPLILSTSAFTIQLFVDRVFLMWYSGPSMAAAMFAGMTVFTFYSFFMGTAMYVNTFVAQYDGADRSSRIGPSIWQGIYFCVIAGLIMAACAPAAKTICAWAAHSPQLQELETTYLKISLLGSMPAILTSCFSCFYTGRAKTWTVLWVNIGVTIVNLVLDYLWIFGKGGFAAHGIAGAAWATVVANSFGTIAFFLLFLQTKYRTRYKTSHWAFDKDLFWRIMRYGIPSGTQFMLDVVGWVFFLAFVGRINTLSLTATSMAFQINTLAFLPMVGFATAVSTLVGRYLGADDIHKAAKSTWSAITMTACYMTAVAVLYWTVPSIFMYPFKMQADPAEFAQLAPLVKNLLIFVGFYCLFDSGNLIFSAAVKGAGDTRFVMWASVFLSWILLVIPAYILSQIFTGTKALYLIWICAAAYVCVLAVVFLFRFIGGKWKSMRVIEPIAPKMAPVAPSPTAGTDEPA